MATKVPARDTLRMIRPPEAASITGLGVDHMLDLVEARRFPRQRILGPRTRAWRSDELEGWKEWLLDEPGTTRVIARRPARTPGHMMDEGEIVRAAKPYQRVPGVYFLVRDGRVVYVGQSVAVRSRLAQHDPWKDFTHVFVLPLPDADRSQRLAIERGYIKHLAPELNGGV